MVTRLVTLGLLGVAAASLSAPASACRHSCTGSTGSTGSTGGEEVPAPAGFALFALGATLLATRRWKA